MSKRKRSAEPTLQDRLDKHQDAIFRSLKTAKGFERQRLSKRLRDDGITADKKERLEREVTVLKSLDLHQTARAHMFSSLLKVKPIAASEGLPVEIRRGLAKPQLSEEENVAMHNVTSSLYNCAPVRKAVEAAIATACQELKVALPGKAKRVRKSKQDDKVEEKKVMEVEVEEVKESVEDDETTRAALQVLDEESEFEGFESDVDEPGPLIGEPDSEADEAEEDAFSKYDHLLGSSSDEDDEEAETKKLERFKGKEQVNLDDISLSGSAPGSDADSDADSDFDSDSDRDVS
ncbi:hypothetical protein G7046_g7152 [Stylonectria norvegica]|nr:hypothetical protein G7046_g7152 [Stylonectria norvegica]